MNIGGKPAFVAFMADDGQMVSADDATKAIARFADGSHAYYDLVEPRALGDVEGHPFHGNQWTSGSADIFRTPDDVVKLKGWGNDPEYYGWKNTPGMLLTGTPVEKKDLPEMLYHVTTAAPAVESSGILRGQKSDAGLGGGQEEGVSFTSSKQDADVIQRELKRQVEIAHGTSTIEDLPRFAREDEQKAGIPAGSLDPAVAFGRQMWDGNIGSEYQGKKIYDTSEKHQSLTSDAFKSYLQIRESVGAKLLGSRDSILKNPLLFGDIRKLRLINPDHIKTLHVPTKNIPDRALITTGSDKFLHEVRAYSNVPIAGMKIAARRDLGDVEGHPFHGNQWTSGEGRDEFGNVEKGSKAEQEHQAWMKSLTSDEKTLLRDYAGPNGISQPINDYLRHGIDAIGVDYSKEVADQLDHILGKMHGTVEQTLYRGVSSSDDLKPGFTWKDKGFVSTSVSAGHALQYFTGEARQDYVAKTLLEIHTPHGAYTQDVGGTTEIQGEHINEREWLLPRDMTYRVKSVNEYDTPAGKRRDIQVEVVR